VFGINMRFMERLKQFFGFFGRCGDSCISLQKINDSSQALEICEAIPNNKYQMDSYQNIKK
jgi:hypothetical protein